MVKGMDKFQEYFADFTEHYVLIGGAASDLLMTDAGLPFRATKDLDIVLCLEALDTAFAKKFWELIAAGGYQNQQRSTGKKIFYRFDQPADKSFPFMLELFSRNPDALILGDDSHLTPIPVTEDVSSLSAILLDDDYYQFIHEHKIQIDNVFVVSPVCLISLKAKAWLDLNERVKAGDKVDSKDIKKHKNDVFRLFQIIKPDMRVNISKVIYDDVDQFLDVVMGEPDLSLKPFGLDDLKVEDVVNTLKQIYQLADE